MKLSFVPEQIELLPLSALAAYPKNPRKHPPEQIEKIAASMRTFGWTMPILVDAKNEVIAGHGRLLAAERVGLEQIPAIRIEHLSPTEIRACRLADNQLTIAGEWDNEILSFEIHDLNSEGFDLDILGFDTPELDELLAPLDDGKDLDETPEPPDVPVSQLGDLWLFGKHRLLCGDSTKKEDVSLLMNGANPHLMVTDPPYGVSYDPDWRNRAYPVVGRPHGGRAVGLVVNDSISDWSRSYSLFTGDVAYVWHPPGATGVKFYTSLTESGFEIRMQIIWAKSHFAIGRGDYHLQHEPCLYAVRKGSKSHWNGDRTQSTLWQINKPIRSDTGHSTQKPVECMLRPIQNNSERGESVYDPFLGSGTTLIAAETSGRICYGMEISPQYIDVAVKRWQNITGEKATLDGDGRTFDEISAERLCQTED